MKTVIKWSTLLFLLAAFWSCNKNDNNPSNITQNSIQIGNDVTINTTFGQLISKSEIEGSYTYEMEIYAGITKEQLDSNIVVNTQVAALLLTVITTGDGYVPSGSYAINNSTEPGTVYSGKAIYYPNGTGEGGYEEITFATGSLYVTYTDGFYAITFSGFSSGNQIVTANFNGDLIYSSSTTGD